MFDQETDLRFGNDVLERLNDEVFKKLKPLCFWVDKSDMTEEEKEKFASYETTGGFLKKISLKEVWREFWDEAPEETKDFIKSLPNFSAEIFQEITGIDVNRNAKTQKITLELTEDEIGRLKEFLKK